MSNRNQTRSRIAKAAWELFRRKGYQETTISDIIEAAGTSRGTFYHYFNGKDELLSTLSYMFDDFYRENLPKIDPDMNSCDKLIALSCSEDITRYRVISHLLMCTGYANCTTCHIDGTLTS